MATVTIEKKVKKVDRLSKCIGITMDEEDYSKLLEYMSVYDLSESSALRALLIDHYKFTVDPGIQWKNNGLVRQLKMYVSSRIYNALKQEALRQHMRTNSFIRAIIFMYLRSEEFDFELNRERVLISEEEEYEIQPE